MAFNGDAPSSKRQRTEGESGQHRNHADQYSGYGDEPRRKSARDQRGWSGQQSPGFFRPKFGRQRPTASDDWGVVCLPDPILPMHFYPPPPPPPPPPPHPYHGAGVALLPATPHIMVDAAPLCEPSCVPQVLLDAAFKAALNQSENDKLNHVLLFTILNPVYPITVEVLHTICSPSGQVLRIVIFKKNGVQAMVEFDSVESAKRAKESLNGADIYSGCCTLKIDYAKPNKLNVYKNDSESWDYTNPNMGSKEAPPAGRPAPLLQEPRYGAGPQPYPGDGMRGGGVPPYGPAPPDRYDDGYQNGPGGGSYPDHYGDRYQPADRYGMKSEYGGREPLHPTPPGRPGYGPPALAQTPGGPSPPVSQQGSVMMVYGLDMEKVNTDKLFNLFCLYGNVVRIKFLKTKEGCAMIQMGDGLAVERCVQNLNNVPLLGSKLQLGFSKQAFLSDVQNPYPLPDKTPSFKDFMGNKNNRFINPSMASKNRIQPPSKILHFFNTPPNITEEMLSKVFEDNNVPVPKTVKLFPLKTDRSSSGLLEFDDISAAVEALMMCNHLPIHNPAGGKFPYIMKLCFSSSRQIPTSLRGGNESGGGNQQNQQSQDGMMKPEMKADMQ